MSNRIIAIGCGDPTCPNLSGLLPGQESLFIPVPSVFMGLVDRVPSKLERIGQRGERDLHVIIGHDNCLAMRDFSIVSKLTEEYTTRLVKSGKRAVGILINGRVDLINPGHDGDPRIDKIVHNAEELRRRGHNRPDVLLKRLIVAPYFESPPKQGDFRLSSLFLSQMGLRIALRLNHGKLPEEIVFDNTFADSETIGLVEKVRAQLPA